MFCSHTVNDENEMTTSLRCKLRGSSHASILNSHTVKTVPFGGFQALVKNFQIQTIIHFIKSRFCMTTFRSKKLFLTNQHLLVLIVNEI